MSGRSFAPVWRVSEPKEWPQVPKYMSVSQLNNIEACPLRWALASAQYAGIWDRSGYPGRPQTSSIVGRIVHLSLKTIIMALARAGCPSMKDPNTTAVLRELGGYTKIINDCTRSILSEESNNPRAEHLNEIVERVVLSKVPEMRESVQTLLTKIRLHPRAMPLRIDKSANYKRSALSFGSHPEVILCVDKLGWKGVADLINLSEKNCEIVDFKTGEPNEEHAFQLRVYSLLWALDTELNPRSRLADTLTLSYREGEVHIKAPSSEELQAIERDLTKRTCAVFEALAVLPPEAKPSKEACCYCSVRQLCNDYWKSSTQRHLDNEGLLGGDVADIELTITDCHGPASWDAIVESSRVLTPGKKIVLRTALDETNLKIGNRIRVLDCYATAAGDDGQPAVATLSSYSEVFLVEEGKC